MEKPLPKEMTEEDFENIAEGTKRESERLEKQRAIELISLVDRATLYRKKIEKAIEEVIQSEFSDVHLRSSSISTPSSDAKTFNLHFVIPILDGDDTERILALAKIGLADAIDDEFFAIDDATWQSAEDGVTADITFIKKQGVVKE